MHLRDLHEMFLLRVTSGSSENMWTQQESLQLSSNNEMGILGLLLHSYLTSCTSVLLTLRKLPNVKSCSSSFSWVAQEVSASAHISTISQLLIACCVVCTQTKLNRLLLAHLCLPVSWQERIVLHSSLEIKSAVQLSGRKLRVLGWAPKRYNCTSYQTRKIQEHQSNFPPNSYQPRHVFLVYLCNAFQVLMEVQTLVSETQDEHKQEELRHGNSGFSQCLTVLEVKKQTATQEV